jgi:Zn-finger nucleic acid-binding protein
LAEALFIISHRWKGAGLPGQGMEAIFIQNPVRQAMDDQDSLFSELFSTHPPVRKRIAILLDMVHMTEKELEQSMQQPLTEAPPFSVTGNVDTGVFAVSSGRNLRNACPRCHATLTESSYEGISVLVCVQCQGFLIKEPDVLRILERRERVFSSVIQDRARTILHQPLPARPWGGYTGFDEQSIPCPSCADAAPRMVRRFVNPRYTVEIDRCRTCGQVWFDRDELELLQCLYEQDHSVPA